MELPADVRSMLDGRRIAVLGTKDPDGGVHLVSVWYLREGGDVLVPTAGASRKARNVERAGEATLLVDSRTSASLRGVTVTGPAEVIRGDRARQLNHRIHARYLSRAALEDARVGPVFREGDDVTIRLTPAATTSWDMRAEPLLPIFEEPGYLLPLLED